MLRRYLRPPARVIDLGAGEGAFTARLVRDGFTVVPVDVDASRFCVSGIPLEVADLNEPFADRLGRESWDACVALEVVEHLRSPYHFIRECRFLLRRNDYLLLSTPNVESLPSRMIFLWNGRFRFFAPDETEGHHVYPCFGWFLDLCFREAGFEVLEVRFNRHTWDCGKSLKAKVASWVARVLSPCVTGDKHGEIRIVIGKAL
jgi:SAM-dependent methyltransferase